jgi:hypothetical protein
MSYLRILRAAHNLKRWRAGLVLVLLSAVVFMLKCLPARLQRALSTSSLHRQLSMVDTRWGTYVQPACRVQHTCLPACRVQHTCLLASAWHAWSTVAGAKDAAGKACSKCLSDYKAYPCSITSLSAASLQRCWWPCLRQRMGSGCGSHRELSTSTATKVSQGLHLLRSSYTVAC